MSTCYIPNSILSFLYTYSHSSLTMVLSDKYCNFSPFTGKELVPHCTSMKRWSHLLKLGSLCPHLMLLASKLLTHYMESLLKKGLKENLQSFPRGGDIYAKPTRIGRTSPEKKKSKGTVGKCSKIMEANECLCVPREEQAVQYMWSRQGLRV